MVIEIREAGTRDISDMTRVLAPAFQDKVTTIIGDDEKAMEIIPEIIRSIKGGKFVAETVGDNGDRTMVGAIIVSTYEVKISFYVIRACIRELGLLGALKAFGLVFNYLHSVPKKEKDEGTLEAVGVLEGSKGQGIGEKLVVVGAEYLRKEGKRFYGLGVTAENNAVKLYEKLDFTVIERYQNKLGNWLYMRKTL